MAHRIAWLIGPLLASTALLGPATGRADVPRACVHPRYDPIACARETREVHRDVLPLARLRALDAQRPRLAEEVPLQDAERNALLEAIRDALEEQERAAKRRAAEKDGP
jgi:hypothetical protein